MRSLTLNNTFATTHKLVDKTVGFLRLDQMTGEDWQLIQDYSEELATSSADRALKMLESLKGIKPICPIDRYEHSLQTATRAYKDGADEEMIVVALLHDAGDAVAPKNHAEVIAAVLRPFICENSYWLLKHHTLFQGYYYHQFCGRDPNERDKYRDHPAYQITVDFCERWDQLAFDPAYENLPLSFFEPMVRRVFARKPFQPSAWKI
jgi:predicted HD phosphohydrolase